MEDLINTMKDMFKNIKKDNEEDKYFYFSPSYNPKVKITDWYLPLEAEPKDNDPYHPPGGNYFLSTYKRFGTYDTPMETTTQAMLRQICEKQVDQRIHKPLVNVATDRLYQGEDLEDNMDRQDGEMDFTTSYEYDYRDPFPYRKTLTLKSEEPQKRFGLTSNFSPSNICETKFLDDEVCNIKPVAAPKLIPPYETYEAMENRIIRPVSSQKKIKNRKHYNTENAVH